MSGSTPAELRRLAAELTKYQPVGTDVSVPSAATHVTMPTVHIRPASNDTAIGRAVTALSAAATTIERLARVREVAQTLDDWFAEQGSQADLFALFIRLHAALAAASDARAGDAGQTRTEAE
jgi:hypothetical protein